MHPRYSIIFILISGPLRVKGNSFVFSYTVNIRQIRNTKTLTPNSGKPEFVDVFIFAYDVYI